MIRALDIDPNLCSAWYNKDWIPSSLEVFKTIKWYDYALEIAKYVARYCYDDTWDLLKSGKFDEAIKCYDKALKIYAEDSVALYNNFNDLLKSGKFDEAIKCYERYLEMSSDRAQILFNILYNKAWALAKLGKFDEAIKCYEKYLELRPNSRKKQVFYNKAWALAKLGKFDEAIKCYEKYIVYPFHNYNTVRSSEFERIDDDDDFHDLSTLGKVEEDIKYYASQQLDPNHKDTWYVKGLVCLGLGEYNEAIMYYDKILEVDPNYMQVWEDKAYALYFLKRYSEANECLDKALSLSFLNPYHLRLCFAKAYILDKSGRPDEAYKKSK